MEAQDLEILSQYELSLFLRDHSGAMASSDV